MNRDEWTFAVTMSVVHGLDHLAKRLFPPLVPVWAAVFGFPLWQLGVVLGAHTLGSAVGQAPIGHLADRGDRRRLLAFGVGLIGAGTAAVGVAPFVRDGSVAGFSTAFLALSTANLAAGLGSSFVHPTGYPLISANVPESARGKVLGMWGSAARFGDGLAPAIVGVLLLVVAWPTIVGGVGGAIVVAAVALLVVLRGFDTMPTASEDRTDRAEVTRDRRTFVYPFAAVTLYFAVQIAATNAVTVFLPQFLTAGYDLGGTVAGVSLTDESSASFYYAGLLLFAGVFQLATGELVDRYDPRRVLLVFLAVGAASLGALATLSLSHVGLVAVLVVLGASLWGLNPARDRLVDAIAPKGGEGKTFGYLWTGTLLVSAAAPPLIGYVGDRAGLRAGFGLLAVVVVLSALPVLALLSARVYRPAEPEGDLAD
ncbi:MAG: MFS transporter [Haloferacaceae archaeon]